MGMPVLIIGKSGSGKSTSMRNCVDANGKPNPDWNVIRVLNKPFPFKGKVNGWITDDYEMVLRCLNASKAHNIVIDDAGYLITNMFMKGHSSTGQGNGQFAFYNTLGDRFWNLIQFIQTLPEDKIVYFMMHEDKNDFGDVKPKTIGKLLDEKVCVEGMFTIVLRAISEGSKHFFVTQTSDGAVSKSPLGLFNELYIDNDLIIVEKAIRDYYKDSGELVSTKKDKKEKTEDAETK